MTFIQNYLTCELEMAWKLSHPMTILLICGNNFHVKMLFNNHFYEFTFLLIYCERSILFSKTLQVILLSYLNAQDENLKTIFSKVNINNTSCLILGFTSKMRS